MKNAIKARLLDIAKSKIRKTTEKYPHMTGAYLTPMEVKLLLQAGYERQKDENSMMDYQLSKIPLGDCTPTWIYFRNELAERQEKEMIEKLRKHFNITNHE